MRPSTWCGSTGRICATCRSCVGSALERVIPAPRAEPDKRPAAGPLPRLRILVIDDDPLILRAVRDILVGDGHTVVGESGGQPGIDAFRAALAGGEGFALVITDLGMPYVDGRQVASAVKQASPSTPIVLLTGWGRRLMAEGEVPAQVDRVVSKPPTLRELRDAVAYCYSLTARTEPIQGDLNANDLEIRTS